MSKQQDYKKRGESYLKYSGLAFQLAGIILGFLYLGMKLDEWLKMPQPIFTALLVLVGFSGFMYKLYIDLTRKQ